MSELYKQDPMGSKTHGKLFGISFLLFHLIFSGLLLFYVLRKSEVGLDFFNDILK